MVGEVVDLGNDMMYFELYVASNYRLVERIEPVSKARLLIPA